MREFVHHAHTRDDLQQQEHEAMDAALAGLVLALQVPGSSLASTPVVSMTKPLTVPVQEMVFELELGNGDDVSCTTKGMDAAFDLLLNLALEELTLPPFANTDDEPRCLLTLDNCYYILECKCACRPRCCISVVVVNV